MVGPARRGRGMAEPLRSRTQTGGLLTLPYNGGYKNGTFMAVREAQKRRRRRREEEEEEEEGSRVLRLCNGGRKGGPGRGWWQCWG